MRHFLAVLGSLVFAISCGTPAGAGEDPLLPIELGRIQFYPSASFSYAYEDNVERRSGADPLVPVVSTSVQDIRPTLRFETMFQRGFTSLSYSAKFREYGAEELQDANGTSHYVDFAQEYSLNRSIQISLADSFQRGITELQDLDPGGELRFGMQPFRSNNASALLSLKLGPIHSLEVGGSLSATRFDDIGTLDPLPNFRSEGLLARYSMGLGPSSRLFLVVDWNSVTQGRRAVDIVPTDYRTRSAGLGWSRMAPGGLSSELRVSYTALEFPEGGDPFQGFTTEGNIGIRLGSTAQLAIKLRRGPLPSFFNVNSFYFNEMAMVGYIQEIGQRLRLLMQLGAQGNSYPEPVRTLDFYAYLLPSEGVRRKDNLRGGGVRLVYHAARAMDLQVEYRRDRVRSNIVAESLDEEYRIFNYDYESLAAFLVVGWQ